MPDFAGYEVSSHGRVQSVEREGTGGAARRATRELKPTRDPRPGKGYLRVQLSRDGQTYNRSVHRLVLLAHVGPPPKGKPYALHGPNLVADNCVGNLYWGSARRNMLDKRRDGTQLEGGQVYNAKLTEDTVREMRRLHAEGWSHRQLAARFGANMGSVSRIVRRLEWKHVH